MTHYPAASFAAFLRSDPSQTFKSSLHFADDTWQRLLRSADQFDTKTSLLRWVKERWPGDDLYWKDVISRLWASYLEWADAQPRLTREQIRDAAGAEVRRAFMPAE